MNISLNDLNKNIFEISYPIGSVLQTRNPNNPNTYLLGGGSSNWTKIEGRIIIAADSTYKVGSKGGFATHTLTVNQLPAHTHSASANSTGAHTHTRGTMNITGTWTSRGIEAGADCTYTGAFYQASFASRGYCGHSDYSDSHGIGLDASKNWTGSTSSNGAHTHTVTVSNTGSGQAINHMPPYIALYIWERVS